MITSPLERLYTLTLMALCAWALMALCAGSASPQTPAACTHYSAPTGSGTSCSAVQPCQVERFWPLAGPGKTLCLKSGTYVGSSQMITPPPGKRGTQDKPITIRAEHDGMVLLDAQGGGFAVFLGWHDGPPQSNDWFVVEGINATRGREATFQMSGSNNRLRRVIGYNGTQGQDDANIFRIVGYNSRAEDCAGWGHNSRKIMDGAQGGNLKGAGYTRCWAEWNDHPQGQSQPNNTYELGYNSSNQLYENVIGTWDTKGQTAEVEGVMHLFGSNDASKPHDMQGSKVLGSIFYAAPGQHFTPHSIVEAYGLSGMLVQDVVAIASPEHTQAKPFTLLNYMCTTQKPCTNNVCRNCLAVHAGTPNYIEAGSGWTLPDLKQGNGLAAATGGESPFLLLPGICREYVGGELTNTPLWPWRMSKRIKDARIASGFPAVDVDEVITQLLGPIPQACRRGPDPEPPIPPEPTVPPSGTTPLACVGAMGEGNVIAVACTPQTNKR